MFAILFASLLAISPVEIPEGVSVKEALSVCEKAIGALKLYIFRYGFSVPSQIIQSICKPSKSTGLCNNILSGSYLSTIYSSIYKYDSETTICNKIGISDNSEEGDEELEDNSILSTIITATSDGCAVCKKAVGYISSARGMTQVLTTIQTVSTASCSLLSSTNAAVCKNIVKLFLPVINTFVSKNYSADSVCSSLKFCKTTVTVTVNDEEIEEEDDEKHMSIDIPEGVGNSISCTTCKTLVKGISTILTTTKVQSQVTSLSGNLCDKLPAQVRDACRKYINSNIPLIMSLISSGLSKSSVCQKLQLC
ncbi:surfactant B protein [Histomonas meleagridis]|uniref:surfactant B protein n=1 Tax=Histomonas meleagridis TaxID=135588 RepID=UPI003559E649|nr:surfactant B protein [Histomonas meleagridis]KAH0803579.1 surfactant B protein [Histomonas meleagridis]